VDGRTEKGGGQIGGIGGILLWGCWIFEEWEVIVITVDGMMMAEKLVLVTFLFV